MTIKPFFYLLTTILVWGSSFPAMSYLLKDLNPMELALGRFLLPCILGLLYFFYTKLNVSIKDYLRFFLEGFFAFFCFGIFFRSLSIVFSNFFRILSTFFSMVSFKIFCSILPSYSLWDEEKVESSYTFLLISAVVDDWFVIL